MLPSLFTALLPTLWCCHAGEPFLQAMAEEVKEKVADGNAQNVSSGQGAVVARHAVVEEPAADCQQAAGL